MESGLSVTKLKDGEEILFGPARRAKDSAIGVSALEDPERVTHTAFRTVCITNMRVIIESEDHNLHYPNKDIRTVMIERKTDKRGELTAFDILSVRTRSGVTVKLDIPGVPSRKEDQLAEVFPMAAIKSSQGIAGFLNRLFGG